MAVELAEHGITVNALAPGAIETELVARMHSPETRTIYRAAIPMDRYGAPEEVAHAAAFLASEEAGYITGEILSVDGGFLAAGLMARRG
jgi:NAD(P)-dependent dehydrogenase (short-subunit alcohol dehydrogenase family)